MTSRRSALHAAAEMPDGAATTIPGALYTDPDHYRDEVTAVLEPAWHCVGCEGEISRPGDFFTVDLLGEPLVIVRGDDGVIRALSNVCRHRGMPIAGGSGRAAAFTCPYHAWSYRNDGSLLTVSYVDEPWFDTSACSLPEFAVEIWHGQIHVTLASEPAPLRPTLDGLDAQLANYEPDVFEWAHTESEVWNTNWKCAVENFIEGYHLSVVHPTTLHHLTPTRLSRIGPADGAYTSFWSYYPADLPSRGPGAEGLTAENRTRSLLWVMFPTQLGSQNASFLASLNVLPEAVDRTRIRWTVSAHPRCDDDVIAGAVQMWRDVNAEDSAKLERLQVALASRSARDHAGPLVDEDKEGTIHRFHRHLASRMPA